MLKFIKKNDVNFDCKYRGIWYKLFDKWYIIIVFFVVVNGYYIVGKNKWKILWYWFYVIDNKILVILMKMNW